MDRLTKTMIIEYEGKWVSKDGFEDDDGFIKGNAINKLAAYEDTGLTPEQIKPLQQEIILLRNQLESGDIKTFYNTELERIKNDWTKTHPERVELFTNQYLTDGFSDEDTWDLAVHLSGIILPRLKRYKELANEMIVIDFPLDDMIEAFLLFEEVGYDAWELKGEKLDKVQKGMKAFSEYFLALWW